MAELENLKIIRWIVEIRVRWQEHRGRVLRGETAGLTDTEARELAEEAAAVPGALGRALADGKISADEAVGLAILIVPLLGEVVREALDDDPDPLVEGEAHDPDAPERLTATIDRLAGGGFAAARARARAHAAASQPEEGEDQ